MIPNGAQFLNRIFDLFELISLILYRHICFVDLIGYEGIEFSNEYYRRAAAHEIGHAMGLGEAYQTHFLMSYPKVTVEVPENDIMRNEYEAEVTANDVEVVLEAFTTGKPQSFSNQFLAWRRSEVIRYKINNRR